MPRLNYEAHISAVFPPTPGGEPTRLSVSSYPVAGSRAAVEEELAALQREFPTYRDWQIHESTYELWSDFEERRAFEKAEAARLAAVLTTPRGVTWNVSAERPGDVRLELYCDGLMVLVKPTQEAIDRACRNPVFVDRSTGSLGGSWWDERG